MKVNNVADPSGEGVDVFVFDDPVIVILSKDSVGALTNTTPEPPFPPGLFGLLWPPPPPPPVFVEPAPPVPGPPVPPPPAPPAP